MLLEVPPESVPTKALPRGKEPLVGEAGVGVGDILISWNVPRMVASAREELEPSGASAVHVKLVILSAPGFKGENRARTITNAANVGAANALNENGLLEGANSSSGFEVVNKATLFPRPDEHATPSLVVGKTGW